MGVSHLGFLPHDSVFVYFSIFFLVFCPLVNFISELEITGCDNILHGYSIRNGYNFFHVRRQLFCSFTPFSWGGGEEGSLLAIIGQIQGGLSRYLYITCTLPV